MHGLNPLGPSVANRFKLGTGLTWLQYYRLYPSTDPPPLAYFPNTASTVLVGSSNATLQVAFTGPFNGYLTYQLSGTAIPVPTGVTGDYIQPSGEVYVANSTSATISIRLVPEPDIEVNRSIVVALSAPPATNQNYTVVPTPACTSRSCRPWGRLVGTLAITNGMFASAQSVKMAVRPGTGANIVALLDVTGNAFLGNTFSVPVTTNSLGFQLNGGLFSNVISNTPWGRPIGLGLSFGNTLSTNGTFVTPISLTVSNLTASGITYSAAGLLTLAQSQ